MAVIPPEAVPLLQAALTATGFPGNTVAPDGSINAASLLSGVYDTVEIRSRLSPTVVTRVAELGAAGPPNPLVAWLKPTIVLSGRAGRTVIAPYGEVGTGGALGASLVLLGLVGIGYLLGRASK